MRRPRLLFLLGPLLFLSASPRGAFAGETVETFPDGKPKAKYVVDEDGKKNGRYVEFFENGKTCIETSYKKDQLDGAYAEFYESGKPRVRAAYKKDELDGDYRQWDEDGAPTRTATYVGGRLNGKFEAFRGKTAATTQIWKDGTLVTWNGIPACPRGRDAVEKTLAAIEAGEVGGRPGGPEKAKTAPGAPAAEALAADRVRALRRLMAYRFLCDVPYEDMALDDADDAGAQAAAEICAKLGRITHEPTNPGMPEDAYRFAANACAACNLHSLGEARASVDGFMDDSDPSNVDRVGHRRWCLNPAMRVTGFGVARSETGHAYSAMWALDCGRAPIPDYVAVCFPARGWNPSAMFSEHHAWSVSWNPRHFPHADAAGVRVEVRRLDEDLVPSDDPMPLEAVNADSERFGAGPCLIFRPKGVALSDGAAYVVAVSGLAGSGKSVKPGEGTLRYFVQFYGAAAPPDRSK